MWGTFSFPCDLISAELQEGAALGAKIWARKDIAFHRRKTVFPSSSVLSLSLVPQPAVLV